MKKILVTASTFPRWENDTEPRFILDLCQALTKYFDVTVLVPAAVGAKEEQMMGDVHVIRYHYFPLHRLETLCYPGAIVPRIQEKKLRILLVPFLLGSLYLKLYKLSKKYDLVHAHWFVPQGLIQSLFKTPYIVTGHGGDVTSVNHFFIKKWKARCVEKAAHVTTVSSYLKEEILRWSEKEVTVDVIPMGCQLNLFSPKNRVDNYFGQGKKKTVLFVGRLAEKKGATYLIEAMKYVDAKLIIAGTGPLENSLKKQALEQEEKIIFLGARTHEELKIIYASADIFAAPSVTAKDGDQEGFGLVLLEAMASGIPVVAFDSGGITQLIRSGENGLLCKEKDVIGLGDAINKVLKDSKLRDNLKKNGIETASKYDYAEIGKRYAEIYLKAMI